MSDEEKLMEEMESDNGGIESSDDSMSDENEENSVENVCFSSEETSDKSMNDNTARVYLPNKNMDDDDDGQLVCDESAYGFIHEATTGMPCLSFDVIPDELGDDRANKYPLSMTIVCGTQSANSSNNRVIVMKMDNVHGNKKNQQSDSEDEESECEDEDDCPQMQCAVIPHFGCVNRIRHANFNGQPIAASWSETGNVHLWDLTIPLRAVHNSQAFKKYIMDKEAPSPLFSFSGHQIEGYAVDWSPIIPGVLATGDCRKNIHLWKPMEGAIWHVDQQVYTAHTASVEDIQWSPNESNVMASCSVDKTIRIWDMRAAPSKACMLTTENAHESDVNVISWNKLEPFILSGGDDGKLKVWDLRRFPKNSPICTFKHHVAPITSVQWHPKESSVFAASGSDDQLTLWDLSVERDIDAENSEDISKEVLELPPQLLFIHQGQKEIKELSWHPQLPGVIISTAQSGFNVFRTLSV